MFTFREKENMKKEKNLRAKQRLIALFRKQELPGCDFFSPSCDSYDKHHGSTCGEKGSQK